MNCGHVIITGGSSGIGLAVARIFTGEGFNVSLIARNKDKLELAKQELKGIRGNQLQKIETFSADVSSRQQIENAISQSVNLSGVPDILVTSAGTVVPGYFQALSSEIFERLMNVNYLGTVYAVKAVEPMMRERGKGNIVMISSGAGLIGIFGYSAYSPSKFAVRGLAESLRTEAEISGINISVVYPPDTETPQLASERKLMPRETYMITSSGGIISADSVAQAIRKGIKDKKFIITPGCSMTLLARLHSLISPMLYSWFRLQIKKAASTVR